MAGKPRLMRMDMWGGLSPHPRFQKIRPADAGLRPNFHKKKAIEVRKTPLFPKPLAKSAIVVYNQVRNRRILACPTVAQSETYKALSLLTDYRLSSIASRG